VSTVATRGLLDRGYTPGYTLSMKTAISIPDNLFKAADRVARRMGISRSELYQRAIERYLQQQSGDVIREALDVVYAKASNRDLDPLIKAAGEHVLKDENW
jgi:metal-responsive CopG/Arc/MetJ family transcriptional regulator